LRRPIPSQPKKWLLFAVKLLIVAVVLLAIRHTLATALAELKHYPWRFDFLWLVVSGGFYVLGLVPAGLFWHHVMRTMGQRAGIGETFRAYFIGHLGKYVPGKAMVVVIRTGLIRSARVDTGVAAASVLFETLTMMSSGAFLSAAILAIWFHQHSMLFCAALAMMVLAGLPTLPFVFRRLIRLTGVGRSDPAVRDKLDRLGYRTHLLGWTGMTLGWVLMGGSLWAALKSMGIEAPAPLAELPRYTASVALAMVAGFLSLIPGGAVVREAILTRLLVPHLGDVAPMVNPEAAALVSAVLLRLVWLVSELVLSGLLAFTRGRTLKSV
jgi:uncharacterized membrane protein YbhN (UPF0104 family)